MPAIECPVLAIQGLDDEYGTLRQLEAIERQVAGRGTIVELESCGHSPHRDQPDATVSAMVGFIREVVPGTIRPPVG